jgi:HAD superfamily hydrolase (TIGR01509 family)
MRDELRDYMQHAMESALIPLKPGVHNILSALKNNGVTISLATSTRRPLAMFMLKTGDLDRYFDETVCGDEVKVAKPAPDIFIKAMDKLGGTTENTIIFEDSHNGIRAANAAGIPVIMVPDLLPPISDLTTFAVMEDLDAALKLILPMIGEKAE